MTTVQSGSGPMVQLRNVPQSFLGNRLVSTSQGTRLAEHEWAPRRGSGPGRDLDTRAAATANSLPLKHPQEWNDAMAPRLALWQRPR